MTKKAKMQKAVEADSEKHVAIFEQREVRRVWHEEQWYFVVNDVVSVLSESANVTDYIKKMRQRDVELGKGWGQIVTPPFYPDKRRSTKA